MLIKKNTLQSGTYPTQSGSARDPRVASVRTGCTLGRYSSEIRTGCANQRPSGSVRGALSNECPYRDRQPSQASHRFLNARNRCRSYAIEVSGFSTSITRSFCTA
jgi:hypothetical protein